MHNPVPSALDVLSIQTVGGGVLLSIVSTSGTEYGNWDHYGVTRPLMWGAICEFVFSVAFFAFFLSIVDSLQILSIATHFQVAAAVQRPDGRSHRPVSGHPADHRHHVRFNHFVDVPLFDLQDGNVAMYVADEVPTYIAIVTLPLLFAHRLSSFHARAAAAADKRPVRR